MCDNNVKHLKHVAVCVQIFISMYSNLQYIYIRNILFALPRIICVLTNIMHRIG